MLGVGSGEFFLIIVVAVLVLGPEHLPKIMKTVQKVMSDFRRIKTDFQRAVNLDALNDEDFMSTTKRSGAKPKKRKSTVPGAEKTSTKKTKKTGKKEKAPSADSPKSTKKNTKKTTKKSTKKATEVKSKDGERMAEASAKNFDSTEESAKLNNSSAKEEKPVKVDKPQSTDLKDNSLKDTAKTTPQKKNFSEEKTEAEANQEA